MRRTILLPIMAAVAVAPVLVVPIERVLAQQVQGSGAGRPGGAPAAAAQGASSSADAVVPPVKRVQPVTPPAPKPAAKKAAKTKGDASAKAGASALPRCRAGERLNRKTRVCEPVAKAKQ